MSEGSNPRHSSFSKTASSWQIPKDLVTCNIPTSLSSPTGAAEVGIKSSTETVSVFLGGEHLLSWVNRKGRLPH